MPSGHSWKDLQWLIESNCEFFSSDARIEIISEYDREEGLHSVHVLRTERGQREQFLTSAASPRLQDAFEDLYQKSAEAVHEFRKTHGFGRVPRLSVRSSRRRGGESADAVRLANAAKAAALEQTEIVSVEKGSDDGDSSSSSASCWSVDSDDSVDTAVSFTAPRRPKRMHRPLPPGVDVINASGRRTAFRGIVPNPLPATVRAKGLPTGFAPPPTFPTWHKPYSRGVPPPPGFEAHVGPGANLPVNRSGALPLTNPPTLKPVNIPYTATGNSDSYDQGTFSMMLKIKLYGHGEATILDECMLHAIALKDRALQTVRKQPYKFGTLVPDSSFVSLLRATIRRVHLGTETIELASDRQDLSSLPGVKHMIPQFDIDIIQLPAVGPSAPGLGPGSGPSPIPKVGSDTPMDA